MLARRRDRLLQSGGDEREVLEQGLSSTQVHTLGTAILLHSGLTDKLEGFLSHVDSCLSVSVVHVASSAHLQQQLDDQDVSVLCRNMQRRVLESLCALILVLSLTNEDSDLVEVTLLAGSPDL